MQASSLLSRYLQPLVLACSKAPALDLACGAGRNGFFLLERDIPVVFADRDSQSLQQIEKRLDAKSLIGRKHQSRIWQVDFEVPATRLLETNSFGAILVFRYLYRPLLEEISSALVPGGLLIYETFTTEQARFGRPRNPDFLLRKGELKNSFSQWSILHDFEGIECDHDDGQPRAIAQLVAQKPG